MQAIHLCLLWFEQVRSWVPAWKLSGSIVVRFAGRFLALGEEARDA
jgi:hypothetical protein